MGWRESENTVLLTNKVLKIVTRRENPVESAVQKGLTILNCLPGPSYRFIEL